LEKICEVAEFKIGKNEGSMGVNNSVNEIAGENEVNMKEID